MVRSRAIVYSHVPTKPFLCARVQLFVQNAITPRRTSVNCKLEGTVSHRAFLPSTSATNHTTILTPVSADEPMTSF
jgi:hypothetical protein